VADPGRLVVVEGIDGSGKTTQAGLLAAATGALLTAEPGGSPLGAKLRHLLLDPSLPAITGRAEALLMAADRAQHVVEVIAPALAEGRWVVSDRFAPSMIAYQGYGRGLEVATLRSVSNWAAAGLEPHLTVFVDVSVEEGRRRLAGRGADRLERLDDAFHQRVADGYRAMAEREAWEVIDGTRPEVEVAADILAVVVGRLGPPPGGRSG
jgi:dTMP kinase